ncbi:cytochrome c oxidase assembly protein [Caldalkalibacillus salinus]|uniref:cytochrome c oxidase assembly protein n=1 Tax=Caldalkalibacillus salinus TaxID=2803787 RepID=UPI00192394FD|nr:cytochrome c oxidase assembly protein [Caldalkalibacillus salinus]
MQHHMVHDPGFFDLWRLDVTLVSIITLLGYLWWAGVIGQRYKGMDRVTPSKMTAFVTGIVLFALVKGSPLDYYGHHYLFSAHMLQMAVIYLVVPPLLLLGLSDSMVRPFVRIPLRKSCFLFFTHPLASIVIFNTLFSLYHLPLVFDKVMATPMLHTVFHSMMFMGAMLMWWPLMNLLVEYHKMRGLRKIAYIFGNGVLITPVCALIIFAPNVIYDAYRDAPQLFNILPVLDDQQLGGVIMKVIQELTYMTAIAIIFFKWAKEERQKEKMDDMTLVYARKQGATE